MQIRQKAPLSNVFSKIIPTPIGDQFQFQLQLISSYGEETPLSLTDIPLLESWKSMSSSGGCIRYMYKSVVDYITKSITFFDKNKWNNNYVYRKLDAIRFLLTCQHYIYIWEEKGKESLTPVLVIKHFKVFNIFIKIQKNWPS